MFEFYDDMTIDDALKFEEENYYVRDEKGVSLNITRMEECRKEMLDALTGGSQEAFNNMLLLDEPKPLYSPDGFIYTTYNGKDLVCIGAIADEENLYKADDFYDLICIADEVAAGAFAIDVDDEYDTPVTLFNSITFPFLKPHGLPAHSMRGQEVGEVDAANLTEKECLDAFSE